MLQGFQRYVASICSKCFICFQTYVVSIFLSGCCTCFTPTLQEYVQNVSTVSVLCCNKCFHVAICKYFIWMLHMFHTHVAIVCSKCFICFRRMLHSSVSCCKCFVFQRYVRRVMGTCPGRREKGCGEPGASGWGAQHT